MALAAQSLAFWAVVGVLRHAPVQPLAWVLLYAAAIGAGGCASRTPARRWRTGIWLAWAGYSVLLSAMFWAASQGLDALHGSDRAKFDVARHLGGLELWLVLFPGVFSVAVAGWVRARR